MLSSFKTLTFDLIYAQSKKKENKRKKYDTNS